MSVNQDFEYRSRGGSPTLSYFQFADPVEYSYITARLGQTSMSTMGEPNFGSHHLYDRGPLSARTPNPEWTPYSAVSSFNLPAHCDSSLVTPVEPSRSPTMPSRASSSLRTRDFKMSPGSPPSSDLALFGGDDDYSSRSNMPMKHKHPGSLKITTSDPEIPYIQCPSPYYGSFGVSATSKTDRLNDMALPNLHRRIQPDDFVNNPEQGRQQYDLQPYRVQNPAPILGAPMALRPATTQDSYRDGFPRARHDSMSSRSSLASSMPRSGAPTHSLSPPLHYAEHYPEHYQSGPSTTMPFQMQRPLGAIPPRRKRKSPARDLFDEQLARDHPTPTVEEQVLLDLTAEDKTWKEVAEEFNQRFDANMKVPALQMRKKRLVERMRTWTSFDEMHLVRAWEFFESERWDWIAVEMQRCAEMSGISNDKWSKEAVQRKWIELHPSYDPYVSSYQSASEAQEQAKERIEDEPRSGRIGRGTVLEEESRSRTLLGDSTAALQQPKPHRPLHHVAVFPDHDEVWTQARTR